MKKLYFLLLLIPSFVSAAIYPGNGGNGFGGGVGNGNLVVTDDGSVITFVMNAGGGGFNGNDLVIYIDNLQGGGYANTSSFTDNLDGGRTAISGYNSGNPSRTLINFPLGFRPQKAISVEYGFVGLFDLGNPANFTYITSGNLNVAGNTLSFSFNKAVLGIPAAVSFNFFATLISTSAYRSNEAIGSALTDPAPGGSTPNYGFDGTINPASFALYPSGVVAVSGLDLSGQNRGAETLLQWTTVNEIDLSGFSIQQSIDGIRWSNAGYMVSANNNAGSTYSQPVKNLKGLYNYFRVIARSLDGSVSFSRVVKIRTGLQEEVVLINSLAQNELLLQFNNSSNSRVDLLITDETGKMIRTMETGSGAGGIIHVPVPGLQKGLYFLVVKINGSSSNTFKFFKQ